MPLLRHSDFDCFEITQIWYILMASEVLTSLLASVILFIYDCLYSFTTSGLKTSLLFQFNLTTLATQRYLMHCEPTIQKRKKKDIAIKEQQTRHIVSPLILL